MSILFAVLIIYLVSKESIKIINIFTMIAENIISKNINNISGGMMNNFNKNKYKKYTEKRSQRSNVFKNCVTAFFGGGAICLLGEIFFRLISSAAGDTISEETARLLSSVSLIFLTALLTGLGWFDIIAKYIGAGALVPITGFANAVAAAAIDNKSEGYVPGVGAKMFIIAGSVVVYGVSLSILYGILYYLYTILF